MKRVSRGWIFLTVWTGGMLAFLYLPIVPLMVNSFNRSRRSVDWQGFTLQWYRAMWHDVPIMRAAGNSLYIAAAVTALSVILGTLGAWVLYRYRVPLKKVLATSVAVPLIVPAVIMGVSVLIFFSVVHFTLGYTTIIIAHTTFCFPFVLIAVHARLVGMDPSMEEAAMSLGATPMQALVRVIVPYLLPAIFSGALMAFTLSMDELIVTYFVAGPQSQTLPVRIFGMARVGLNPTLNAISTLFIVGTAIIVFVGAGVWYRGAGATPQARES
jgi:spermidine/putrescine transport system permease protein